MLSTLRQKSIAIHTSIRNSIRQSGWINRLILLAYAAAIAHDVHASIMSAKLCTAYNNIFDNAFVGMTGMFAFTMMFLKWKFADKSAEAMGTGFKIAICLTGLVSLATILGWFGVAPC